MVHRFHNTEEMAEILRSLMTGLLAAAAVATGCCSKLVFAVLPATSQLQAAFAVQVQVQAAIAVTIDC